MSGRIAVVVFPGTNCEHDVVHATRLLGAEPALVWHRETSLAGFDSVILPGGFAHGDYLRTGAIARFSPVMTEVAEMAKSGAPVLGICNGFQVLCETGLLPGALVANRDLKFICRSVSVRVEQAESALTGSASPGDLLELPLNSYEGNFVAPPEEIDRIEAAGQVVLRYAGDNPNGSTNAIAGIANEKGNVVGLMPHPERASEAVLGSEDGLVLLESFVKASSLVAT